MNRKAIPIFALLVLLTFGTGFGVPPPVTFKLGPQNLGAQNTYQVGLADLDGDSDLDAVFASSQTSTTPIYLNDGAGNFTLTGQFLLTYQGHGLGMSDFDGDGDIDLFLTYADFTRASDIYFNDGTGFFVKSEQVVGDPDLAGNGVHVFDIDGDGDDDVLVDYYLEDNKVYENDGAGVLVDSGQIYPEDAAFADFDGDNDIDILECDEVGLGYRTWINDGSGNFTELSFLANPTLVMSRVGFGDLDNDGDVDAVVADGNMSISRPTKILLNDGSGVFTESATLLVATNAGRVCVGDFNRDGYNDIILTSYNMAHQLYVNDGEGGFVWSQFGNGGNGQLSLAPSLADINHDGWVDFIVPIFENGACQLWINTSEPSSCCENMGDFDHNGQPDAADIVAWVGWAFNSNPIAPGCEDPDGFWPECDMDGSSQVDVADIVFWTRWSYSGGPAPTPCP